MTEIQHTNPLLYYDEPIVFEAREGEGRRYLAMAVESLEDEARYLIVAASSKQLGQLSTGRIDMRSLLLKAGKNAWFIATTTTGTRDPMWIERQRTPLEKSGLLPDEGFFLDDLSDAPSLEDTSPTPMQSVTKAFACIQKYAKAYSQLECMQLNLPFFQKGDQKTGVVGEFYVYLFLRDKHPASDLCYGNTSQKGWDIEVSMRSLKVQVKTVSQFSKARGMSPIHPGWDELHILYLDKKLKPMGFWIVTETSIADEKPLKNQRCPDPKCPERSGSNGIPFGENRIEDLRRALTRQGIRL